MNRRLLAVVGAERVGERVAADGQRLEAGLDGGMHAVEHGGQGWSRVEWALVEEQYGRTTNAIHWHVPNAYNVWAHASDEPQAETMRRLSRAILAHQGAPLDDDATLLSLQWRRADI